MTVGICFAGQLDADAADVERYLDRLNVQFHNYYYDPRTDETCLEVGLTWGSLYETPEALAMHLEDMYDAIEAWVEYVD